MKRNNGQIFAKTQEYVFRDVDQIVPEVLKDNACVGVFKEDVIKEAAQGKTSKSFEKMLFNHPCQNLIFFFIIQVMKVI